MSEVNHYKVLGLNNSASPEEVKRAYRDLARRYHPDVNPDGSTEERFKAISDAYSVLSDDKLRADHDYELSQKHFKDKNSRFYEYMRQADKDRRRVRQKQESIKKDAQGDKQDSMQRLRAEAAKRAPEHFTEVPTGEENSILSKVKKFTKRILDSEIRIPGISKKSSASRSLSVIEVSVSIHEAIGGTRKKVEIDEGKGTSNRKVMISVPAGVRSGSVVRLRDKSGGGDEIVVVVRVGTHPHLSIDQRGLVIEIPISISEAVNGASITVPSFEDPVLLKVPSGTQSGSTLRIKGRGIKYKTGERGDLLYRLMVQIPESGGAVGLDKIAEGLDAYYPKQIRDGFPSSIDGFKQEG